MGLNRKERVELHCHTSESKMNGIASSGDIFSFAKKEGMKAIYNEKLRRTFL